MRTHLAPAHPQLDPALTVALGRSGSLALAVVVIAIAAYSRLTYLVLPFDGDGAMFAYMGKLTAEGGRFGSDLVDNKFPTVGLITAAFYRTFGGYWPGYVVTQLAMTLAAAVMLGRQAGRTFGPYARWPMVLCGIVLMNMNAVVFGGFQLETIQAFFSAIAGACCLAAISSGDRRDAMAAGLAAGCAALIKPSGGGVLLAFALAMLPLMRSCASSPGVRRQSIVLLLASVVGVLFPMMVAARYLIATDQLHLMPGIARQIAEYASNSSFAWDDLLRPVILLAVFAAALLIRGWVYRRPTYREICTAPLRAWAFVIAWLAIEFIGILVQRRMYGYHFLPLCAPAALLFAALPRRATVAQVAGPLTLPVLLSVLGAADTLRAAEQPLNWPALTAWLEQQTSPGDRIWRDNTPQILVSSDLRSASRMQLTFLYKNTDAAPLQFSSMLINDWRTTRPRFIVLPAEVDEYVEEHCKRVHELARIPARAANYRTAWAAMVDYVHARYRPDVQIGDEQVWRIRSEQP